MNLQILKHFSRKLHYDYVISGGGSAGLALANRISQSKTLQKKKLLLIEKGDGVDLEKIHKFPDTLNRVYLTNPKSVELFESIGIWEELEKSGAHLVRHIEIWDEYVGFLTFNGRSNSNALCYSIDNNVLVQLLYKKFLGVVESHKHDHKLNTHIKSMKSLTNNNKIELTLSDDSKVTTDLLIGCDGANSQVRKLAQIETWHHDYNMIDHVGTVKYSTNVKEDVTFKKFSHNGYVAFISLGRGVASLSWCVNNPFGQELMQYSNNQFVDELNKTLARKSELPFQYLFGKSMYDNLATTCSPGTHAGKMSEFSVKPLEIESIIPGSRLSYPLKLILAKTYVKDNVILIGDAAHRINPVTGQGLNLGIKDVIEFASVLENTHLLGCDNYHPKLLENYNRNRRIEVAMHVGFGTATNYIFANDIKFLTFFRSLGLRIADKFPFKDALINKVTC